MKKRYLIIPYIVLLVFGYTIILPKVIIGSKLLYFHFVARNAKLTKPKLGMNFLGFYKPELPYSFLDINRLETDVGLDISIISYYQSWGKGKPYDFPKDQFKDMENKILMITWEPWLVAFGKNLKLQKSSLKKISSGYYDNYIIDYAKDIVLYEKPVLLRFAHEPTNPMYGWSNQYGNSALDYKSAWRHIYNIFKKVGAKNVSFVWSPYTENDVDYYPGNDYVDYIGFDIFNYGNIVSGGKWLSFYDIIKPLYDSYKKLKKPMFVAELGCANGGGGNKKNWYKDAINDITTGIIKVNGIVFFDFLNWKTSNQKIIDWSVSKNSEILDEIENYQK